MLLANVEKIVASKLIRHLYFVDGVVNIIVK